MVLQSAVLNLISTYGNLSVLVRQMRISWYVSMQSKRDNIFSNIAIFKFYSAADILFKMTLVSSSG